MRSPTFRIDNRLPVGVRADWLIGAGATPAERGLVYASAAAGGVLAWGLFFASQPWAWWQSVLAVLIAADLFGGATANAASSTKRQYREATPSTPGWGTRLVCDPVAFAALHVYPIVIVALYPGGSWAWGLGWYLAAVAAVALVARGVPGYLQRPAAMAVFVLAVPVVLTEPGPPGWSWLPLVFLAKLLLAHAVHEEAYRP